MGSRYEIISSAWSSEKSESLVVTAMARPSRELLASWQESVVFVLIDKIGRAGLAKR